jgi:hypothetical protein
MSCGRWNLKNVPRPKSATGTRLPTFKTKRATTAFISGAQVSTGVTYAEMADLDPEPPYPPSKRGEETYEGRLMNPRAAIQAVISPRSLIQQRPDDHHEPH